MTSWRRPLHHDRRAQASQDRVVALVEAHACDVLAYLQRRTDSPEDAADLLSETLTVAWRRLDDLPQDGTEARMWLFATARNTLANHRRGTQRASELGARLREDLSTQAHTARAGADDQVVDDVRKAIEQLSAAQRELVTPRALGWLHARAGRRGRRDPRVDRPQQVRRRPRRPRSAATS